MRWGLSYKNGSLLNKPETNAHLESLHVGWRKKGASQAPSFNDRQRPAPFSTKIRQRPTLSTMFTPKNVARLKCSRHCGMVDKIGYMRHMHEASLGSILYRHAGGGNAPRKVLHGALRHSPKNVARQRCSPHCGMVNKIVHMRQMHEASLGSSLYMYAGCGSAPL